MLNERKFRSIYEDYLESGLTIRDFCSNQSMSEAKFYYWQHRLKGLLPSKRGFVPVVFENEQYPQSSASPVPMHNSHPMVPNQGCEKTFSCEISYPNGVQLKLSGGADLETLRSLLLLTR